MIDPDKLPAAAVEAARKTHAGVGSTRGRQVAMRFAVAAFLTALLADDEAMERAYDSWSRRDTHTAGADPMRAALTAAVQS